MTDSDTLVIHQSAWKIVAILIVGLAFVAAGVVMVNDPDGSVRQSAASHHFWGWAVILFFGFCSLVMAARLLHPPTITLGPDGFSLQQFHRHDSYRWSSVKEFHVFKVRGAKVAAWRLHDDAPEFGASTRVGRLFGADGSVGNGWDRSPREIVALLQAWKDRYDAASRRETND